MTMQIRTCDKHFVEDYIQDLQDAQKCFTYHQEFIEGGGSLLFVDDHICLLLQEGDALRNLPLVGQRVQA